MSKPKPTLPEWSVEFSENGWEYSGFMKIVAQKCDLLAGDDHTVIADGVRITLDEQCLPPVKARRPTR